MKKIVVGLFAALVSLAAVAGFVDERSARAPAAQPGEAAAAQGGVVPVVVAPVAVPEVDLSLRLRAGDLISVRLAEWSQRNGYSMTWEASEYRSEAELHLATDYESALDAFLGSMRLSNIRLEAEIFANKAVRIQEVK